MPKFRSTTFRWFTENPGDGEHMEFAAGAGRVGGQIDIYPGTLAVRYTAASDLLGYNIVLDTVIGGKTRRYISRQTPWSYPVDAVGLLPSNPSLISNNYASTLMQGTGIGAATFNKLTGANDYPVYRFTLVCQARDYAVKEDDDVLATNSGSPVSPLWDSAAGVGYPDEGDALRRGWDFTRYTTLKPRSAGKFITLRTGFLEFEDGTILNENFPFNEVSNDITVTWHCVPLAALPVNAIQNCLGKCNKGQFAFAPEGTLLFLNHEYDIQPGPLNDFLCTVTYHFRYAPKVSALSGVALGHNASLRITGGTLTYARIRGHGDTGQPYPVTADFASLFRPDQPS